MAMMRRPVAEARGAELAADLLGQLTGGDEDEALRAAGCECSTPSDEREAEGQGLARAGGGPTGDVTAGQRVGDGGGLDRRGDGDVALGQQGDEICGHAEVGEGR